MWCQSVLCLHRLHKQQTTYYGKLISYIEEDLDLT